MDTIDLRPRQAYDTPEKIAFHVTEGIVDVDLTTFKTVAASLNWEVIPCIKVMRMIGRENETLLSLKSCKDIVEYLVKRYKPASSTQSQLQASSHAIK